MKWLNGARAVMLGAAALLLLSASAAPAAPSAPTAPAAASSATELAAPSAEARNATGFDRDLALRTFDAAWERVRTSYFDEDFGGVDWHAVRDELRPKVENVSSNTELQGIIQEMLNRLGQSHFAIVPRDVADAIEPDDDEPDEKPHVDPHDEEAFEPADGRPGHAGLTLYVIDETVVVTRVEPDSPAEELGVRPGWAITAVRGRNLAEFAENLPDHLDARTRALFLWHMIEYRLQGAPGTRIGLTFLDHTDEEVELHVRRIPVEGESTKLGNMPTMYAHLEHELIECDDRAATIGLIRFNVWMLPMMRPFAEAIDALQGADGIVIDLRGNPGGIGAMAMSVAGFFTEDRFSLGTMKNRQTSIAFRAMPQFTLPSGEPFEPYAGPVALLIDEATGSTSEIFAAGMQESGRALVFGATSYGGVLPSVFYRLPNGDVLQHAIADFISSEGVRLEGRGVLPDQPVRMTREALLDGRDPVLEAAIEWIAARAVKPEAALAE